MEEEFRYTIDELTKVESLLKTRVSVANYIRLTQHFSRHYLGHVALIKGLKEKDQSKTIEGLNAIAEATNYLNKASNPCTLIDLLALEGLGVLVPGVSVHEQSHLLSIHQSNQVLGLHLDSYPSLIVGSYPEHLTHVTLYWFCPSIGIGNYVAVLDDLIRNNRSEIILELLCRIYPPELISDPHASSFSGEVLLAKDLHDPVH